MIKNFIFSFLIMIFSITTYGQEFDCKIMEVEGVSDPGEKIANDLLGSLPILVVPGAIAFVAAKTTVDLIEIAFKNNAYGKPKVTTIPLDKTDEGILLDLGDGDKIEIKSANKEGSRPRIIFRQPKWKWWKGVVLFSKEDTNTYKELACIYDDKNISVNNWDKSTQEDYHLVLSKAKALGVHTNMYLIDNFDQFDTNKDYLIAWKED